MSVTTQQSLLYLDACHLLLQNYEGVDHNLDKNRLLVLLIIC